LAQYRDLRERYDILTLARTPELCTRVTLMPVEQLGVDRARRADVTSGVLEVAV
jgi:uroporphyrinogen decarboxylase